MAALPELDVHVYRVVKGGNADDEMEDACKLNIERGRFAVADGATESSFADVWAQMLVRRFVEEPLAWPPAWATWLPPLQEAWQCHVAARDLPWYAQDKAERGAFSTLLGFVVHPDGTWRALAVGDSCLVQVRDGAVLTAFPLSRAADFNSRPFLIGSRTPIADLAQTRHAGGVTGTWRTGDRFLLMTDALACWFLRQSTEQQAVPEVLDYLVIDDNDEFAERMQGLRDGKFLKNDDVTLVHVGVKAADNVC